MTLWNVLIPPLELMDMTIIIGTSGWSYDDWVGPFYPRSLRTKKGEWLEYYGQFFNSVEINSTFYNVPKEAVIKSWVSKAKRIGGNFEFSLKLPQIVTHEVIVKDSADKAAVFSKSFEKACVRPLADRGLLGAVLIQFSPYFHRTSKDGEPTGEAKLRELIEVLSPELRYVAEFRHRSWLDPGGVGLDAGVKELLREFNIACCALDGPGLPALIERTADHGYIRFHGRNDDLWFGREKNKDDPRMNRYDYDYSDQEMDEWIPRMRTMEEEQKAGVRVYLNNHPNAKAVSNGLRLKDLLGIPQKKPVPDRPQEDEKTQRSLWEY